MKVKIILGILLMMIAPLAHLSAESAPKASAQEKGIRWVTDYETAKKEAESTGKPLFLLFTGSPWCQPCVKLEKTLENPEFVRLAGSQFVYVKFDFPSQNTSSDQQVILRKFGISGFPTVLIQNSNGKTVGQTGFRPGGPADYAAHLRELVQSTGCK